ncbi:MAG: beta-ketoacyl synthase, partial [Pirellulales bacterium]
MAPQLDENRRIVITGIGLVTSVGHHREAVWNAVCRGQSGVRRLVGIKAIPDGLILGAPVTGLSGDDTHRLKPIPLCMFAAAHALADAEIDLRRFERHRFGCAISGHMGDTDFVVEKLGRTELIDPNKTPWWEQWMPNTACAMVANRFGLIGPRICHSTACSSGLIDILAAVRAIQDNQCDQALAGSAEAIHPLLAAGFYRMGVLANHADPTQACRPFDADRSGFVMGEGAAMFVLERLSKARERGARIYAEILGGHMLAEAHHVTGLDAQRSVIPQLILQTLQRARLTPKQIGYINAHGTGTRQNDVVETMGIRRAFGPMADRVAVSATKSMLGHLVNASGGVEMAITTLALRDGFLPPTINLTHPDPQCDLDYVPLVGRHVPIEHALKISIAFGGHLAAIVLRRWSEPKTARERRGEIAESGEERAESK